MIPVVPVIPIVPAVVALRAVLFAFAAVGCSLRLLGKWIFLHRKANSLSGYIDLDNSHHYFLLNADHLLRILDKVIRQVTDMDKSVLVNAHIYKRTEIGNIRYEARETHAYLKIADAVNTVRKAEYFEYLPRVASWFLQFRNNIG